MNIIPQFIEAFEALGWDPSDDIVIDMAGTHVSSIDVGDEYDEKWQSPIGTRKYNKDAFIVIKNNTRTPFAPSVNDDPQRTAHHGKLENSDQQSNCEDTTGQPSESN